MDLIYPQIQYREKAKNAGRLKGSYETISGSFDRSFKSKIDLGWEIELLVFFDHANDFS
jgi:hypothetical protein